MLKHAVFLLVLLFVMGRTERVYAAVGITGPNVVCEGSGLTELRADSGYVSYRWSTGESGRSAYVTTGGTYTVYTRDRNGMDDSGSITIRGVAKPRPFIGNGVQYLCNGDVASLQVQGTFRWYRWNSGDTTQSIAITTNGVFRVTVMDSNGCVGTSDSLEVVFLPLPEARIIGPNAACRNSEVAYQAVDVPGAIYTWSVAGGTIVAGQSSRTIRVRWNTSGQVALTVTRPRPDGGVCTSSVSTFVRVGAKLRPELLFDRRNICVGDSTELRVGDGYSSYRWNTGDTTATLVVRSSGLYWVEISDSSGCSGISDSLEVFVYDLPTVEITGQRLLCQGDSTILVATPGIPIYAWNTGARSSSITVGGPGTYRVIGTTLNNCSDTATFEVMAAVRPRPTMPALVVVGPVAIGRSARTTFDVQNASTDPFSVMRVFADPPIPGLDVQTPALPHLVNPGRTMTVQCTWAPTTRDTLRTTIVVETLSDCQRTDTISLLIVSTDPPPPATLTVKLPTVVTQAGSSLALPITASVTDTSMWGTIVDIEAMIRFDRALLLPTSVSRGLLISDAIDDTVHRIQVRALGVQLDTTVNVMYIFADAMLAFPNRTALEFESITITPGDRFTVIPVNGSCTVTACFVQGRVVRFTDPMGATVRQNDDGSAIECTISSSTPGTYHIRLHSIDGGAVAEAQFDHVGTAPETHTVHIPTQRVACGLYVVRIIGPFETTVQPVLLHE